MATTTLTVDGMTCSHCEHSITEALTELPEISSVSVSATEGTAVVEHEGALNSTTVREAIEAVGYTLSS